MEHRRLGQESASHLWFCILPDSAWSSSPGHAASGRGLLGLAFLESQVGPVVLGADGAKHRNNMLQAHGVRANSRHGDF